MAEKATRSRNKEKKSKPKEITFFCSRCEKHKPISEMRTVTRFIPALIVCQDCARELR
jgi:hypothetical protein